MKKTIPLLVALLFASCAGTVNEEGTSRPTSGDGLPDGLKAAIQIPLSQKDNAPKVAVFDWDNTMIKNDIGDATFFHIIENGLYKAPVNWRSTSLYLTAKGLKALNSACPIKKGMEYLPTKESQGHCGKLMLSVYTEGKTLEGDAAWIENYDHKRMEPSYAWAVSLLQGYTPDEVGKIAEEVIAKGLAAPEGSKKTLHGKEYDGYLRIYAPMKDLVAWLQKEGADVWVISASQQTLVEAFARRVGIAPNRVIGVRLVMKKDKFTTAFQDCGGTTGIITYRQGKRCWANKVIFKINEAQAQLAHASLAFGAGDSDTDLEFLMDAQVRLVVNRQKTELMCNAINGKGKGWFITPMFISPKAPKSDPYDCSKWGLPNVQDI